ncbi:helix-turn-helix domain-containing protein [Limnohabitans sp.]|uniref:helix-turn-helix domain-containing protein n=1 Tax=Limnohabitans sp. TaxID=1907725 RepID=UPI00286EBCDC|nr:helix-turn-helix domain-containing protein [Limnohabitans sp.]
MTEETYTPTTLSVTAGELLRQHRENRGLKLEALAQVLRVSPAKLKALEADRLDELPDTVFARALTLAVCRHLNVDASPVLALLPSQDVSRLATKNERGLDFPLDRPSFLPQSSFLVVARLFTPMRWAALVVLSLALILGFWPDIHTLLVFKEEPATHVVEPPVSLPVVTLPPSEEVAPEAQTQSSNMVLTTVHSTAVTAQSVTAAVPAASTPKAADAR